MQKRERRTNHRAIAYPLPVLMFERGLESRYIFCRARIPVTNIRHLTRTPLGGVKPGRLHLLNTGTTTEAYKVQVFQVRLIFIVGACWGRRGVALTLALPTGARQFQNARVREISLLQSFLSVRGARVRTDRRYPTRPTPYR